MRLGLLGGTFDPVHLGHLILAEQCREQCELDEVWFLPTNQPPHKAGADITPAAARVAMLELAIAGHASFSVSRMELEREGTTYTVDTLEQLRREDPERELYFLIGADSLADLVGWRQPERIVELATVVAVNRGDDPMPDLAPLETKLGREAAASIQIVAMPGIDISSTDILRRARNHQSLRYLIPRAVEVYIQQHRLYQS